MPSTSRSYLAGFAERYAHEDPASSLIKQRSFVVRLDPDRALSQRLRDQLAGWASRPFHLFVARAPSIRLLRPLEGRVERPPVARPRMDRESLPEWVDAEDAFADLEQWVRRAVEHGAPTLSDVTQRVLREFPASVHYVTVGRVADIVARIAKVASDRERRTTSRPSSTRGSSRCASGQTRSETS